MEAACNVLSMLSQLTAAELNLDGADDWVDALALRFASAKGLAELLARTASSHPPHAQRVRDAQQRINEMAEQAVSHTLAGDHRGAVQLLLAHGERTLNGKLIEMARMTLQRHHEKIADGGPLQERVEALRSRYGGSVVPGLGQAAGRQAGALTLRERGAPAEAETTAPADAP
jgi:hypothetical protein